MAFGYLLEWECVCAEHYRRLVEVVEWQFHVRQGDVVYNGDPVEGKLIAIDTWSTRSDFEEFYSRSLLPALVEMGAQAPVVTSWEIPNFSASRRAAEHFEVRFGPWLDYRNIHPSSRHRQN